MVYGGEIAVLATQHGKEQVIAPTFAVETGLLVTVPRGLDTDSLGTFTGEVPRPASLRDTLRMKARLGMAASGCAIGIASEGSFGPHPMIPFVAAGREAMIFIDEGRGIEVIEEAFSERTNFAALQVTPDADVQGFLDRVGFPNHALVLRHGNTITKGITERAELGRLLGGCIGALRLETDMRAHLNPTRMDEIGRLAARLARRVATPCPACQAPGFGRRRSEQGLPCEDCGTPTGLTRAVVLGCTCCGHAWHRPRPDGRAAAPPAECPECNP